MAAEETPSITKEFIGEIQGVLECIQHTHPGNSTKEAPRRAQFAGGKWGEWLKASQETSKWHCSLSPTYNTTMHWTRLPGPGKYWRFHPLQPNRCAKTKKYVPNEKTGQNSRKRTKWWRDSQPIRCMVQNTGNQVAHRNGWVWSQDRGRSEGYVKWNKAIYTGSQQWRVGNGLKWIIWNRWKQWTFN